METLPVELIHLLPGNVDKGMWRRLTVDSLDLKLLQMEIYGHVIRFLLVHAHSATIQEL